MSMHVHTQNIQLQNSIHINVVNDMYTFTQIFEPPAMIPKVNTVAFKNIHIQIHIKSIYPLL